MSSPLATAIVGVVFGVALAAPPGPMNAIIAEESVLRGWRSGFRTGVGAMLADGLFFVLTFAGVAAVLEHYGTIQDVLFLVGGLLMLVFAVDALENATAATGFVEGDVSAGVTGFQKAFLLSLSNPYQIAFWLTVGVGLVRPGSLELSAHVAQPLSALLDGIVVETGSSVLLVGFFGGIFLWIVAYPAALVVMGRRIDAFAPLVAFGSGVVLAGFGAFFSWIGVAALL
ncbi:LysE family translocator [Natrialbaceae archaeon AArc-T1-2]|uniref:LysE family translocator n=1 Tax=Natrialbaceae archaeon AArc-T1-2 TaxID=3053904 RepID=UPI00255A9DE6|nr:LysE family transporter [Natrialbaceae archaeon AArc-T1-2]WIV66882.1 LysE family transporter [Natrialbaceae archaeon AArc-T1-2]